MTIPRSTGERALPMSSEDFATTTQAIVSNIEKVIEGKTATIRLALAVMLAEGHLLIEDVPGVGKTKLAKALARSIHCSVRRIQFTPDLLPSDVTGVSVYNQENREFEFKPGAIFANIVVGDEINRASPKTQSALLECMEERQVTVDGMTYELHAPFMVIATQNPIEMEGTYPLPEAQRDRFTARIAMGYPDNAAELAMLDVHAAEDPVIGLAPVADAEVVRSLIETVRDVHVADIVKQYAVNLCTATRESADLRLGASPRATLQLLRTAPGGGRAGRSRLHGSGRPAGSGGARCSPTASSPPRRRSCPAVPPIRSSRTWFTGCRCRTSDRCARRTHRAARPRVPNTTRGGDDDAGGSARPHRTWPSLPVRGRSRVPVRPAVRRTGLPPGRHPARHPAAAGRLDGGSQPISAGLLARA